MRFPESKERLKGLYLRIRLFILYPFCSLRKMVEPEKGGVKNIFFLRHDRIGDMVFSTAALKSLRRTYPSARIVVLASPGNHEVLKDNPHVDEILVYRGFWGALKEIRKRRFDLAIDPFLTYELKQAFLVYLSGARFRVGFEEAGREVFFNIKGPTASPQKTMLEHLFELVEAVGGRRGGCVPEISLSKEELEEARARMGDAGIKSRDIKIAFHPGAHYPSQMWPIKRFGEVARMIQDSRFNPESSSGQDSSEGYEIKVILFGDRREESLLKTMRDIAGERVQIFCGYRLREFMALLSQCHLLVCNNSGPLHIASALGVPTVSIMGPTVAPLWLPWGENHIVIRKDMECNPCNRAECNDHRCMELITVEEVFEAVRYQMAIAIPHHIP